MTSSAKIFLVDAFTDRPYAGNPAAVMLVDEFPEDSVCQRIAAEMNLSETAFVKHLDVNRFHIRWFTPTVEIKLCGHATLGTAHVLCCEKRITGDKIIFESLSGELPVLCSSPNKYTLDFPLPSSERCLDDDIHNLSAIIGEKVKAALQIDDDLTLELDSEESVRKYVPKKEDLMKLDCRALAITAEGTKSYDFISRCFAPKMGILEDPVTGSAHCMLAYYWRRILNKSQFTAYQASSRGGEIGITIVGDRVHLTGNAVLLMSGHWHV